MIGFGRLVMHLLHSSSSVVRDSRPLKKFRTFKSQGVNFHSRSERLLRMIYPRHLHKCNFRLATLHSFQENTYYQRPPEI